MNRDDVINLIIQNNGVLLSSEAIESGISRSYLSKLTKEGVIERADRGAYMLSDSIHDEMYCVQNKNPKCIFSHETALFFHELTDRTPGNYSVTIPSGTKISRKVSDETKVYYVKPELIDMGRIVMPTSFGNDVYVYDAERTVCDMIRSRNRCDVQMFTDALKKYVVRSNADYNKLTSYAKKLKIDKILSQYMEVML